MAACTEIPVRLWMVSFSVLLLSFAPSSVSRKIQEIINVAGEYFKIDRKDG